MSQSQNKGQVKDVYTSSCTSLSISVSYQPPKTQIAGTRPGQLPTPAYPQNFKMEEPQSLRSLFASAKEQKETLGSRSDTNTEAYSDDVNATIAKFQECQRQISILSLFSSNESLEDVSTNDIQYVILNRQNQVDLTDIGVQVHVTGIFPCRTYAASCHLRP